ncbi:hypothetical protein [Streptomyces sp. NPDC023838]|uniref:hypothetical protein n=1 Tax=Streptomyces sp. NPDC023838 TaxID=3154325 RepID=UPI0033D216B2
MEESQARYAIDVSQTASFSAPEAPGEAWMRRLNMDLWEFARSLHRKGEIEDLVNEFLEDLAAAWRDRLFSIHEWDARPLGPAADGVLLLLSRLLDLLSRLLDRAAANDGPVWTPVPIDTSPQVTPRGPNSAFPVNINRGGHHRSTLGSVVLAA